MHTDLTKRRISMDRAGIFTCLLATLLGAGREPKAVPGKQPKAERGAVLVRKIPLEGVRGPADRTGISGRIDHMAYDSATHRLFVACVANGTLEAIDLDVGERVATVAGLLKPQGVAVSLDSVYVTTGGDGRLHRFDKRSLAARGDVAVGDDADNVRLARDGKLWVSFGGEGPGGLASFDLQTFAAGPILRLPRMPEGFQLHPTSEAVFANLPAGKRSTKDGSVVALRRSDGKNLWERKLSNRSGNFPMALDTTNDWVYVVTRRPPLLVALKASDGDILAEAPCAPESDDLFFDSRTGLLAVIGGGTLPKAGDAGGSGSSLDLFVADKAGRLSRVSNTPLPPHTRTGAMAADRRAVYVGVPSLGDRSAEVWEFRLPD